MKLIADMHIHTNVSHHAFSTLQEMCSAAAKRGLRALAITNHAPAMPDSAHLWHFASLHELPRKIEGVYVLRGAEVNILDETGAIDLPEDILEELDFVVASFHKQTFKNPTSAACTAALDNILQNPYIHLLGHMGAPRFAFDYAKIISRCAAHGKAIELNGSSPKGRPGSRERCLQIARLCGQYGVPVMIDSDAHFSGNLCLADQAVEVARDAGLPEAQIINGDWERFCSYMRLHCGVDPKID